MALTPKQQRFVDEYLIDLNATQAALRAGYSEKTSYSIGQENLNKPEIAKAIGSRQEKIQNKVEVTQEWIVQEFIENHKLAREAGEIPSSNKALENLGRYLGMFKDKVEHTGNLTLESVLKDI